MFCLSDYGFAAARPLTTQLQILTSALWFHPRGPVVIPWGLLLQWRIPDPGLNLPRAGAFSSCRGGGRVVIWKSRRFDLLYGWSLVAGGILLSRSRVVSGIFFHEYHYDWLWTPIRLVLVLIVAMSIVSARFRWRPVAVAICWMLVMLWWPVPRSQATTGSASWPPSRRSNGYSAERRS